ncbi:hypothetical protein L1887_53522 [Cichorium endivia]|nr:hypothetical protein L1887_53522 [Cichorium endivia]
MGAAPSSDVGIACRTRGWAAVTTERVTHVGCHFSADFGAPIFLHRILTTGHSEQEALKSSTFQVLMNCGRDEATRDGKAESVTSKRSQLMMLSLGSGSVWDNHRKSGLLARCRNLRVAAYHMELRYYYMERNGNSIQRLNPCHLVPQIPSKRTCDCVLPPKVPSSEQRSNARGKVSWRMLETGGGCRVGFPKETRGALANRVAAYIILTDSPASRAVPAPCKFRRGEA